MLNKSSIKRYARRVTKNEWAYLAGILDGEGSISAKIGPKSRAGHAVLRVIVSNTDRRLTDWLEERFGGYVVFRPKQAPYRDVWQWCISGLDGQRLLTQVLPSLKLKQEQAHLAVSLPINKKGVKLTEEQVRIRTEIAEAITCLNRRGRS